MTLTSSTRNVYQLRILDIEEKNRAFEVLRELHIHPSQAIRLFLQYICTHESLPFEIERIPNSKTKMILQDEKYIGPTLSGVQLLRDLKR